MHHNIILHEFVVLLEAKPNAKPQASAIFPISGSLHLRNDVMIGYPYIAQGDNATICMQKCELCPYNNYYISHLLTSQINLIDYLHVTSEGYNIIKSIINVSVHMYTSSCIIKSITLGKISVANQKVVSKVQQASNIQE